MSLDFIKSTRFWAMIIGAILVYLKGKEILGEDEFVALSTIVAGFISIRTVDRFSEKMGSNNE